MGRHDDERYESEDEDRRSERKRKFHKSSRKHDDDRKTRKRDREDRHRRSSASSDESSASSSDSRRKDRKRRKKEKKHRKKSERREKKHSKKACRKDEKRRLKDEDDDEDISRLERNYIFTNCLQSLLELQPGMASELPVLLIRLADGTSFNLDQMPDARVSARLQQVLASLSQFGVERDETGSWSWNSGAPDMRRDPLLLLKIARTLLDQIGITMKAVEGYEEREKTAQAEAMHKASQAQETLDTMIEQTNSLLQQFQKEKADGPSLAQELASLCDMILSGESISLDGIPDESLRNALQTLFHTAGLEKSEMEDSDDEASDDDDEPVMGYGLPEANANRRASANMTSILEACKASVAQATSKRAVKGPMMPPKDFDAEHGIGMDDEEDEEGPAPIGSEKALKRVQKGPSLPPEVVKAMAEKRKRELAEVTGADIGQAGVDGEREQWMLEPGEHDLLQGIKTGKTVIKSRNFENKKKRPSAMEVVVPVDPSVQAEVDTIMEMQRQARGPSLIEQHRLKKAEAKAAEAEKGGKASWKWDRDKNLEDGRRVDKNALNMVMGGAAGNLKDKFQGGLGR